MTVECVPDCQGVTTDPGGEWVCHRHEAAKDRGACLIAAGWRCAKPTGHSGPCVLLEVPEEEPRVPSYWREDVPPLTEEQGRAQSEQINGLRTRIGEGDRAGYLSNQVWNMRNRYLASKGACTFDGIEVRVLVEGFLAELAAPKPGRTSDQRCDPPLGKPDSDVEHGRAT